MATIEPDTVAVTETTDRVPNTIESVPAEAPTETEAEAKSAEEATKEETAAAGEQSTGQPASSEAEQRKKRASLLSLPFKKTTKKGDVQTEDGKPIEATQETGASKKESTEIQAPSAQKRKSLLSALKRVGSPKRELLASTADPTTTGKEDEAAPDAEVATSEPATEATKSQETETGAHTPKEGFLSQFLKKPSDKKEATKKDKEVKAEGETGEEEVSSTPLIEEVAKRTFAPFSKLFSPKPHEKLKSESSPEQVDPSGETRPEGAANLEAGTEAAPAASTAEATQGSPTIKSRTFSLFGQKSKPATTEPPKETVEGQVGDQTSHAAPADSRSAFKRMSSIFRSKSKSRENKEETKPEITQINEETQGERTSAENKGVEQVDESKPKEESQRILGDVPAEAINIAPELEVAAKEVVA